jgi:hypothetical protein
VICRSVSLAPVLKLIPCSICSSILKMKALIFSEIYVDFQWNTRRCISEHNTLCGRMCICILPLITFEPVGFPYGSLITIEIPVLCFLSTTSNTITRMAEVGITVELLVLVISFRKKCRFYFTEFLPVMPETSVFIFSSRCE